AQPEGADVRARRDSGRGERTSSPVPAHRPERHPYGDPLRRLARLRGRHCRSQSQLPGAGPTRLDLLGNDHVRRLHLLGPPFKLVVGVLPRTCHHAVRSQLHIDRPCLRHRRAPTHAGRKAMNSPIRPEVLRVRNLSVEYPNGHLALDGLDLTVATGQTVGLIGPSGCGKTTAARAMLNLFPPGPSISGSVSLDGLELQQLPEQQMRKIRWERLALIPQAAMNALDPVMPVDLQIAEVIRTHRRIERRAALEMAQVALESVGIHRNRASSYPHQFSGGM